VQLSIDVLNMETRLVCVCGAKSCDNDYSILRSLGGHFTSQNAMKRQRNVRALISVLTPSVTAARTVYRMQISQYCEVRGLISTNSLTTA
jgi:hypothetical protein